MTDFQVRNPDFKARIQDSFKRQAFMANLGAKLVLVEPGAVDIELDFDEKLCQQHGLFHGGVVGTLADNAGGYASFSLMRAQDSVLTVEYKINLMAPAEGDRLIARGRVVRAGRQLIVCRSDVFVEKNGKEKQCAAMLGTFMVMSDMSDSHQIGASQLVGTDKEKG